MNPYTYTVSFRLQHPSSSLREAFETLGKIEGLTADRLMDIGEQRTTPNDSRLEGTYSDSRCVFSLTKEWQSSSAEELSAMLEAITNKLGPSHNLLKEISDSGGKSEFFVGLGI